jgi:hypothetical protein
MNTLFANSPVMSPHTCAKLPRRALIGYLPIASVGLLCLPKRNWASTHFWDVKPPTQWSADEIAALSANSPWAKQVTAQYRAAMEDLRPDPNGQPRQGRGEATVGECGLVACGDIMPGTVTVIWESAPPMIAALHSAIPAEYNGRYVISVRGLEGSYSPDRLKAGAELSAKGRPPIQPGLVSQRNSTWIFGFSKDLLPLTIADKDIQFTVKVGASFTATLLRATFNPKEMTYRGTLAL